MDVDRFTATSETALRALEVVAAYVLVGLFAIGVFDLGLSILQLAQTGELTETSAVVALIDDVLLLFIVVEIYQTVVAYAREESVVRIVIVAGVIAVARKIIVFQPTEYGIPEAAYVAAGYAVLLAVLVGALYVVRTTPREAGW
ncbi:phosphate-starvation-inducible PsiE family protein [Salarchaeum sp. JOR-1]|uniref:phosphate-starvation-inducible PsiE family protein n=1 Tax=Salarchaeum sp. JOR-1 TaxID=2599399 RepID=UPI00119863B6|nr:phosphate-starvation-inducible PsiE family protein [Salarchaeum sp. JOR-1]QDX40057.1 hypothetical protein FQU85_03785 [Salarchaeum sp. JOR-1]